MFQPYSGPWNDEVAAHLLRRTVFGPTKIRIQQAVDEGFDAAYETLFTAPEIEDQPVYYHFSDDPLVADGDSWIGFPIEGPFGPSVTARRLSLNNWWKRRMRQDDQSIMEKLILFWHNHFPIESAGRPNMNWVYLQTLRNFALGNFRDLTKKMTIDQSMLIYLNGTENLSFAPNENYARELLELFTIGKGPVAGPGDYTNYTEDDIRAIARSLTGWYAWTNNTWQSAFLSFVHDNSSKQLSPRFDNQMIENAGADEYSNVIDIIFGKDEVARHICRRLYIWFVNYRITPAIETGIIEPMAQLLIENDYQIKPALEALLKSEHFYSEEVRGCMIKNPFDFFFSVFNTMEVETPSNLSDEYLMWNSYRKDIGELGMFVLAVPSVAGWSAYHQAPIYYRDWINSASIGLREKLLTQISSRVRAIQSDLKGIDYLQFISGLNDPLDPNLLIDELCFLFYPQPMTTEQKLFFKDILIQGLPDFEWTDEYSAYLANPDDQDIRVAVEQKLKNMFTAMWNVPEFHLS